MKHYPSISRTPIYGKGHVFDKLDGSNIRAEWNPKKGFYKFGSRKLLIGSESILAESVPLIEKLNDTLGGVFRSCKWESTVCFFEFLGPSSFAGQHTAEEHRVVLLDVDVYKQGLLDTSKLLSLFASKVETPALLGTNFTKEMEEEVRAGTLEGMSFEGVVVKLPVMKRWSPPEMFKVKSQAWIDRVIALHGEKAEAYL